MREGWVFAFRASHQPDSPPIGAKIDDAYRGAEAGALGFDGEVGWQGLSCRRPFERPGRC